MIGTQGLLSGWTATAYLSPLTSSRGEVLTPTAATYNANGAGCSGSNVSTTVPLTSSGATIRTAGALCIIAGWNMTVAIAVPSTGVVADTYSGTLTQSIA